MPYFSMIFDARMPQVFAASPHVSCRSPHVSKGEVLNFDAEARTSVRAKYSPFDAQARTSVRAKYSTFDAQARTSVRAKCSSRQKQLQVGSPCFLLPDTETQTTSHESGCRQFGVKQRLPNRACSLEHFALTACGLLHWVRKKSVECRQPHSRYHLR